MKKVNENIESEVQKTLAAFDHIQKASPRPFLYTRLNARLQGSSLLERIPVLSSPVWIRVVISVVVFLVLVNVYTVSTVQKPDIPVIQTANVDELQAFIGDFYPQTPTVYNLDEIINQ